MATMTVPLGMPVPLTVIVKRTEDEKASELELTFDGGRQGYVVIESAGSERITSLARYLQGLPAMIGETALNQWLERTLDDSAIRRIVSANSGLAMRSPSFLGDPSAL